MPLVEKVAALFEALSPADVRALPLYRRQQLAALLRHWAAVAEPGSPATRQGKGVLAELGNGERSG